MPSDSFRGGKAKSDVDYLIKSRGGKYREILLTKRTRLVGSKKVLGSQVIGTRGTAAKLALLDRATVRVTGVKTGKRIRARTIRVVSRNAPVARQSVTGQKKIAVILFNFTNLTTQPITTSTARGLVFTDSNSVREYYDTASDGDVDIVGKVGGSTGDVFGWYTIPMNFTGCSATNMMAWVDAAKDEAEDDGHDMSGYDHVIVMSPVSSPCSWGGKADGIPGTNAHISLAAPSRVRHTTTHEVGHLFGMAHASSLGCVDGVTGADVSLTDDPQQCTHVEYGDPFDLMGTLLDVWRASPSRLPHGPHKIRQGFLPSSSLLELPTNGYGTYALKQEELPSPGDDQTIAIKRYSATGLDRNYLYLDYRATYGIFDNFASYDPIVNGVGVRVGPDPSIPENLTVAAETELVNANLGPAAAPLVYGDQRDWTLRPGRSLYDPASGGVITLNSLGGGTASVTYSAAPVGSAASTVDMVGGKLTYTAANGESNNLTVMRTSSGTLLTDNAAPIYPAPFSGCSYGGNLNSVFCDQPGYVPMEMYTGDGNDAVSLDSQHGMSVKVVAGEGDDKIYGGYSNDALYGGNGADILSGSEGTDIVDGGYDCDVLSGGIADDSLVGGPSDEDNTSSGCFNSYSGGSGNDTLTAAGGGDTLFAEDGNDTYQGGASSATVDYSAYNDPVNVSLDGLANDGFLTENDNVKSSIGSVIGTAFNDTLIGASNNNILRGGGGNDTLDGKVAGDQLYGDGGNDTINDGGSTGSWNDAIYGGSGVDTVTYADRTSPVIVSLNSVSGNGVLGESDYIDADVENAIGGSGGDMITGNASANDLTGGGGNDSLSGAGGDDTLRTKDGGDDSSIVCGSGTADQVLADLLPLDVANSDCEAVGRS